MSYINSIVCKFLKFNYWKTSRGYSSFRTLKIYEPLVKYFFNDTLEKCTVLEYKSTFAITKNLFTFPTDVFVDFET